jgi:hypothetical protein
MEVDPPYIFDAAKEAHPGLSFTRDAVTAVIEMAVHGRWNRRLCLDVYTMLRKCMAENPPAIIVDLRDLQDLDGESANMWLAAARAAGTLQPPAQFVLSLPPTRQLAARLRRLGAVRYLPIFVTMAQARAAVARSVPLTDRLQLRALSPEPASVGTACDLVAVACDAWLLQPLAAPSRQVMRELVTNAVQHARTQLGVTVSRRDAGIYVAVSDGDARLPCLAEPALRTRGSRPASAGPPKPGNRGLWAVHERASAWGAMPAPGGKLVWAIVRPRVRLHGVPPAH